MTKHKLKKKVNGVNEWSATSKPVSSGNDGHVPQLTPDRHQASARTIKFKTTIAT